MKSSISLGEVAPQQLLKFWVMSYDSHTNNVMAVGFQCDGKWMVPGCQQEYESCATVNTIVLHPNEVVALKYSVGMGRVKVADVCCRRNVATWYIETLNQHPWSVVMSVSAGCIVTVMKLEKQNLIDAEAEAVHIILTGIDNDIYSTMDACANAKEMWLAIEHLMQGETINKQDVETNLFWALRTFTSRDGESRESYYSRFYKLMNDLARHGGAKASLRREAWPPRYEIDKGVDSRRGAR
ncbi:hypothetical protein Tco_1533475 [Tanacetum coccineum]